MKGIENEIRESFIHSTRYTRFPVPPRKRGEHDIIIEITSVRWEGTSYRGCLFVPVHFLP